MRLKPYYAFSFSKRFLKRIRKVGRKAKKTTKLVPVGSPSVPSPDEALVG